MSLHVEVVAAGKAGLVADVPAGELREQVDQRLRRAPEGPEVASRSLRARHEARVHVRLPSTDQNGAGEQGNRSTLASGMTIATSGGRSGEASTNVVVA